MSLMATEVPPVLRPQPAPDGELSIFQEVLQTLVHEHPLEQTLNLVSRRVSELAGFSFCGVLLPEAGWRRLHLAGAHNFPPRYGARLNDIFLVPVGDETLVGSPTRSAVQQRHTAVLNDALTDESFRPWRPLAVEFGYRSLVSVPLLVEGQVIGVLNGYSEEARQFPRSELAAVEALAVQAALALRLSMLVEARQGTISELRSANDELRRQRSVLERAHEIHLRLTAAVLAGADFQAVVQTLADLISRGVAVIDQNGHVLCTSTPPPDPALHEALEPSGPTGDGGAERTALVGKIRVGAELLGYVVAPEGDATSRDLDVRAVEHGATVLALEIVKERVARATEERLQADFLADLVSGRDQPEDQLVERARHYGLTLGLEHRVVVIQLEAWAHYQESTGLSEAVGTRRRTEVLHLIGRSITERLPGSLVSRGGETVTAAVPTETLDDPLPSLRSVVADMRRRVDRVAPGLGLSVGIGGSARNSREFAESHRDAQQCVELLRRLERAGDVIARDELGILGLFIDSQRSEELTALAERVLGPVLTRDAVSGSALVQTLEEYLNRNCDARACAEALYVHVNTVKYRLRRIEELSGLTLRNPADLLTATIATLALKLL
jgi:sugar diacid utilization regulator/GAF domain-containing protein